MKDRILKKIEEEIRALDFELKTQLPKEIKKAREHGDLTENAEYKAAKERQSFLQLRISMLQRRASDLALINLDQIPHDRVGLGSTVHMTDLHKGNEIVYQIVIPEEADPGKGLISASSPIGRSLVGKEVGDTVKVQAPAGVREFEIVKLQTIHDI